MRSNMMIDDREPHPLEDIFDIEAGSTDYGQVIQQSGPPILHKNATVEVVDQATGEVIEKKVDIVPADVEKEERVDDLHIDAQLETIHNSALVAFEKQSRMAEESDPRFSARNAEVAAQYLNIALNAVNTRVDAK